MTKRNRIFHITIGALLALIILWGTLMTVAFMFFATNYIHRDAYDIWVAGVAVTRANQDDVLGDGTVTYRPSSNTLTFQNALIELDSAIVQSEVDLRIRLIGENKFICKDSEQIPAIYAADNYLYKDISFEGEGSLEIEFRNVTSSIQGILADNLTIDSNITITMPDCKDIANGIVCGSSLIMTNNASVTVNNGSATHCSAVRVRGNALFEEGAKLNISVNPGAVETCKGLSVNGDLILGKGVSLNVSVDDESAKVGECVRVTGLLEVGNGASLTASAKKNSAIVCYGSVVANDAATVSATKEGEGADIFCYGVFFNDGAILNAELEAIGGISGKIEN